MVPDPGVTEQLRAAAALLLQPPDERTLAVLQAASGERLDPGAARQDFYDTFCIPRSGRYIPPYRHVLLRARELQDYWYFPPPRYNGGDGLVSWYESIGFDVGCPADGAESPFGSSGLSPGLSCRRGSIDR